MTPLITAALMSHSYRRPPQFQPLIPDTQENRYPSHPLTNHRSPSMVITSNGRRRRRGCHARHDAILGVRFAHPRPRTPKAPGLHIYAVRIDPFPYPGYERIVELRLVDKAGNDRFTGLQLRPRVAACQRVRILFILLALTILSFRALAHSFARGKNSTFSS